MKQDKGSRQGPSSDDYSEGREAPIAGAAGMKMQKGGGPVGKVMGTAKECPGCVKKSLTKGMLF